MQDINPHHHAHHQTHSEHLAESWNSIPKASRRISLIIFVGLIVGLVEYGITSMLAALLEWRFNFVQERAGEKTEWMCLFYILPAMTVVAAVVAYLSPISAGSALPEIKGYLNGAHIPGIFGITTMIVKALGVVIAIAAGYPVGREGPMVQVGCAVANQSMKIPFWRRAMTLTADDPSVRKEVVAEEVDRERTLLLTIGGAAGIAAAFRSPIGGVLYMMEDMASYWNHETTVRAFGCTMTATLVFSFLLDVTHGINYEALVVFDEDLEHSDWLVSDIPWFAILAILCGVLSVCYSELLFSFQRIRKKRKIWRSPFAKTVEVFLCTLLICSVPLYIGSAFPCRKLPADDYDCTVASCNVCNACCKDYLELGAGNSCDSCALSECTAAELAGNSSGSGTGHHHDEGFGSLSRYTCEAGSYNEMASLWLMGEEGAIKQLYTRGESRRNLFSVDVLAVFIVIYLLLGGFTGGLALPFGTFVPNLFMGAALGRMFALLVQEPEYMGVNGLSSPGMYALIGAGSMLGGYTRMTLTVVIMLAEASGDVSIVVPMMLSVQISRWVANFLSEAYDEQMMDLRRIPFLHDSVERSRAADDARSVMVKTRALRAREPLKRLRPLLNQNLLRSAFPIVDGDGHLLGLIHGLVLERVLVQGFEDDENENDMVPLEDIADPSPFTVLDTFPLFRLYPLFRKLQIEQVVVINNRGHPIGYIPRTALVDSDDGALQSNTDKTLRGLDMTATAKIIRRQSTAGSSAALHPYEPPPSVQKFEKGELYDDHVAAADNVKKLRALTSWFSPRKSHGSGEDFDFVERNSNVTHGGISLEDYGIEVNVDAKSVQSNRSTEIGDENGGGGSGGDNKGSDSDDGEANEESAMVR
eukprot:CAMPEP_0197568100 /NCGR_PEP_ID=MMETSP1320-20131121/36760_1 /TAXON_ID=91990 /ORGANISM="Bolidomonas sp., Strain RCC2347" /LENGTH=869 /DNA_ID=CAMNT_0043130359 /DNA_START=121 /DNA_END=2727 /DNA_ORIENTATION=-